MPLWILAKCTIVFILSSGVWRFYRVVGVCLLGRLGVGISANGKMVGPPGETSNAVICSPGGGNVVQQYNISAGSFAGIVPHATSGTGNFSCAQANGVTAMMWTRYVFNGDADDAQVSLTCILCCADS